MRAEQDGLQQRIEIPQRIRFSRPDDSALVQVGPDLLIVNHLKPYPTWPRFAELIKRVLGYYDEVARPEGLRRIGLRYINIIEFGDERIELGAYFTYYPHVPDDLPQEHGRFMVQTQLAYREGRDFLTLTVKSHDRDPGASGLGVVLDLDYVTPAEGAVPPSEVGGWLESAHAEIERAFEACITDKTRALFGEDDG
ncbi:MAG: TIGR04255 family protein [Armatimonadota bacterium]